MGLSQRQHVLEQDFNQISSVQQGWLGERAETRDGRVWRYGLAGASNLAIGKMTQAPLGVANHQNLVVVAAQAAGDKTVTVTLGGTAATLNQYQMGYAVVYDSTGAGQALVIRNHSAQTSTTGNVVLQLDDPITTAITTSSKISLSANPYASLIISDASGSATTDLFTGVPCIAVTAANYGWFQVAGVAAVLTDGTPAVGAGVIQGTTAGAVAVEAAASVGQRLGVVHSVSAVTAKYNDINLSIAN
jgi:hypothetical protein